MIYKSKVNNVIRGSKLSVEASHQGNYAWGGKLNIIMLAALFVI